MSTPYYLSDRGLSEYLLFHYGPDEVQLPWPDGPRTALHFPERCVNDLLIRAFVPPGARALDLGCGVGRATFELTRYAAEVIGIDLSERFVGAAERMKADGQCQVEIVREGRLSETVVVRLPPGLARDRARFEVGDAQRLREDLGTFDVILAANLIDRVPSPRALLKQLPALLRPGGQLILTSPYTWLEEYAPTGEWLDTGDAAAGHRWTEHLRGCACIARKDLPFLIREHARKFQWSVAEATNWRKAPPSRPG